MGTADCTGGTGTGEDEELDRSEEGRDVVAEETRLVEYDGGEAEDGRAGDAYANVGGDSCSSKASICARESTTRRENGTDVSVSSKDLERS